MSFLCQKNWFLTSRTTLDDGNRLLRLSSSTCSKRIAERSRSAKSAQSWESFLVKSRRCQDPIDVPWSQAHTFHSHGHACTQSCIPFYRIEVCAELSGLQQLLLQAFSCTICIWIQWLRRSIRSCPGQSLCRFQHRRCNRGTRRTCRTISVTSLLSFSRNLDQNSDWAGARGCWKEI